jgi:BirA family biotin operon repressor/biotin-[acetyl-CoA-carboxylase] ligase
MTATQTSWGAEQLWRALRHKLPGLSVEIVARVGSTNSALLERARARRVPDGGSAAPFGRRAADFQPCLLVAEQQTSGRGRLGRSWQSARGASLTFSLSLPLERADWSGLSLAVGVAIADALEPNPTAEPRIGLKWPNDLWLMDSAEGGRKFGGILIETVTAGKTRLAIIGVGLNIDPVPVADPASGVACIHEFDPEATPPSVLARIAPPLVDAVLEFDRSGFAPFAAGYARRDLLRGHAVSTTDAATPEGVVEGLAGDGALLLRTPDGVVSLRSGEVSVRPQPGLAQEAAC